MAPSVRPDLTSKIYTEPPHSPAVDHFDLLPDSLLLLIFNQIANVKTIGRCSVVSKRFHTLIPKVENVVVRVDYVISDDDATTAGGTAGKPLGPVSSLVRLVISGIVKPKRCAPCRMKNHRDLAFCRFSEKMHTIAVYMKNRTPCRIPISSTD